MGGAEVKGGLGEMLGHGGTVAYYRMDLYPVWARGPWITPRQMQMQMQMQMQEAFLFFFFFMLIS